MKVINKVAAIDYIIQNNYRAQSKMLWGTMKGKQWSRQYFLNEFSENQL